MRYRRTASPGASYFFTLITHQRTPLFLDLSNITRWHRAVEKVQRSRPFFIDAEVILPDHIHVIWTLPDDDAAYDTRIRLVKTAFTKDIGHQPALAVPNSSRQRKGERAVWQRRYWEHLIRDQRDYQAHLDYVHINPVKHGYVASPSEWPHSTFSEWLGRGCYEPQWGTDVMPSLPEWAGRE